MPFPLTFPITFWTGTGFYLDGLIGEPLDRIIGTTCPNTRIEFVSIEDKVMDVYYAGSDINVRFKCYDSEGRLIDPTIAAVSIYDPSGKQIVISADCTKISEGYYKYNGLRFGCVHLAGVWTVLPEVTDSGVATVTPAYNFEFRKVE